MVIFQSWADRGVRDNFIFYAEGVAERKKKGGGRREIEEGQEGQEALAEAAVSSGSYAIINRNKNIRRIIFGP